MVGWVFDEVEIKWEYEFQSSKNSSEILSYGFEIQNNKV